MITRQVTIPIKVRKQIVITRKDFKMERKKRKAKLLLIVLGLIAIFAMLAMAVLSGNAKVEVVPESPAPVFEKIPSREVKLSELHAMVEIIDPILKQLEIPQPVVQEPTQLMRSHEFTVTAYCPCEICCGSWALKRNGPVVGAAGTELIPGVSIAVDTSLFKLGTKLYDEYGNEYIAADTGSGVNGYWIDIYMETHEQAKEFGKQTWVLSW